MNAVPTFGIGTVVVAVSVAIVPVIAVSMDAMMMAVVVVIRMVDGGVQVAMLQTELQEVVDTEQHGSKGNRWSGKRAGCNRRKQTGRDDDMNSEP